MENNLIHKALENLDGYLISIKRNVETGMYYLEVGFRKNWVFKSTENIKCDIDVESETGTLLTISGKHDEVTIDDLIDFVDRVIETNRKITEMQEEFKREIEKRKEEMANRLLEIEDELERVTEKQENKSKLYNKSKKTTEKSSEISIEDDEVLAQKIS